MDPEQYDAAAEAYRSRYGYDDMSDEQKDVFDEHLDKIIEKRDNESDHSENAEDTDGSVDDRSDFEKFRDELKCKYGYDDMSDEQKQAFDEKLDEVIGQETSEDESPDQQEKVLIR